MQIEFTIFNLQKAEAMISRKLRKKLLQAARQFPVVTLTGPRQSGKTTLVKMAFPKYAYASLEDPDLRELALNDPRGFLAQFTGNVILDEAQRAPDLFSYIQTIVDNEDQPGRFILTGSQNFLLARSISQSLAGRCAVLHLLPFSLSELMSWPDVPLDKTGNTIPSRRQRPDRDLFNWLTTGFYPRIHDKGLSPNDWLRNYLHTYIERDVRDVVNVGDLEAFRRFMGLCAGRAGQLLNLSSLAADCGITHTTARRWLSILETSFIVIRLSPHHRNFNKRLIKSPKLYFLDPGLLSCLLKIRNPDDLHLHSSRGAIFENFVVAELYKKALHSGMEPNLFFWRDSTGHEIDVIMDRGVELMPLEIKSGQTVAGDFFKGLDFWRNLSGHPDAPAALIYAGDRSFRTQGINVHSWWNF